MFAVAFPLHFTSVCYGWLNFPNLCCCDCLGCRVAFRHACSVKSTKLPRFRVTTPAVSASSYHAPCPAMEKYCPCTNGPGISNESGPSRPAMSTVTGNCVESKIQSRTWQVRDVRITTDASNHKLTTVLAERYTFTHRSLPRRWNWLWCAACDQLKPEA